MRTAQSYGVPLVLSGYIMLNKYWKIVCFYIYSCIIISNAHLNFHLIPCSFSLKTFFYYFFFFFITKDMSGGLVVFFFFKLYNNVLVLPNIEMNLPQVNPCSPSWTLLPPLPSLWVVPVHQPQASSTVHRTWTGNSFHIWYYTCFNAILLNLPTLSLSHRVHKTDLYISVSFAVSYTRLLLPSF